MTACGVIHDSSQLTFCPRNLQLCDVIVLLFNCSRVWAFLIPNHKYQSCLTLDQAVSDRILATTNGSEQVSYSFTWETWKLHVDYNYNYCVNLGIHICFYYTVQECGHVKVSTVCSEYYNVKKWNSSSFYELFYAIGLNDSKDSNALFLPILSATHSTFKGMFSHLLKGQIEYVGSVLHLKGHETLN